jgi:hypothetical protein
MVVAISVPILSWSTRPVAAAAGLPPWLGHSCGRIIGWRSAMAKATEEWQIQQSVKDVGG